MEHLSMVEDILNTYGLEHTNKNPKVWLLGTGSSRAAFAHDDFPGVVCKLPLVATIFNDFCDYGDEEELEEEMAYSMTQMYYEISTWLFAKEHPLAKFLNPILEWGYYENVLYTIAPQIVELASENRDIQNEMWDNEDYAEFELLMGETYHLSSGDLINNTDNFGRNAQNEIVFIDYGFPRGGNASRTGLENNLNSKEGFIHAIEHGLTVVHHY